MASIRVGCLALEESWEVIQIRITKWDDKTMGPCQRKPLGLMSFPRLPWLQDFCVGLVRELLASDLPV